MAETKIFELREGAGAHKMRGEDVDGNPLDESMVPGERVRSAKPLDKMFPNKFVSVEDEEKKRKKKSLRGPLNEPVRPPKHRKVEGDLDEDSDEEGYVPPETYDPDIDHTSENDEDEPKAVKRAKKAKAARKGDFSAEEETNDDAEAPDDDEEASAEKYGKDVTEEVEGAEHKDLKVFFKKKHYFVFDGDGTDPLHDAPMTKKDMTKFIQNYRG